MNPFDLDIDQDFEDCFRTGGGAVVECDCGREHVAITSEYFDWDGEDFDVVQDYRKRAETDENLFLHEEWNYIGEIEVGGKLFADCCECEGWKPYKNFIISDRHQIREFLVRYGRKAQIALEHEKTFNILKDTTL